MKKFLGFGVAVFALVSLSSSSTKVEPERSLADITPSSTPAQSTPAVGSLSPLDRIFDLIYPYYTIECSLTQVHKIGGTPGGIAGHALLYVKGACRDTSSPYPKLMMCPAGTDLGDRNSGVVVSVDKILANTAFIAFDGFDFMFNGAAKPGDPIDQATMTATMNEVVASGAAKGIKVHTSVMDAKGASPATADLTDEQYIAMIGADTDYALSFGRDSSCVRVPMNRAQIEAEVNYMNTDNEQYTVHGKIRDWDALGDNCADYTHDVLVQAGIRKEKARSASWFRKFVNLITLHMSIPRNEVLATTEAVNNISKIETAADVYADKDAREIFDRLGTLPEIGGIFEDVPMRVSGNSLYQPPAGALFLDVPLLDPKTHELKKVETLPEFDDLQTNMTRVLTQMQSVQKQEATSPQTSSDQTEQLFIEKYNAWLDHSVDYLTKKLAVLKLISKQEQ